MNRELPNSLPPPKEPGKKSGISRRNFLKLGTLGALGYLIPQSFEKTLTSIEDLKKYWEEESLAPTLEQVRIEKEDEKIMQDSFLPGKEQPESLSQAFSFKEDKEVPINLSVIKNIYKKWLVAYSEEGPLNKDLQSGYQRMQPWLSLIEPLFKKQGVPTKYAFLAIPESHFRLKAVSEAKAAGPYQFIKKTAEKYGLRMDNVVDERFDPIKSAEACAQNLAHLFAKCGDWNLALSGYNGGFIWEYLRKEDKTRSYEGFLSFISEKVNSLRKQLKNEATYVYAVERGDSFNKISKKFSLSLESLKRSNKSTNPRIALGQKLVIPLGDIYHREKVFKELTNIKGLKENLNYPAKFHAVYKLIEQRETDASRGGKKIKFKEVKIPSKERVVTKKYAVKKGDTLWSLGKKFRISPKTIAQDNKIRENNLRTGEIISIPEKTFSKSLQDFVDEKNPLSRLVELNPAIISSKATLPEGMSIRIS